MSKCVRCQQVKAPEEFEGFKSCKRCRDYNKVNRTRFRKRKRPKPPGSGRTPAVVLGRRHCSTCTVWRPIHEFGVAQWWDPFERTRPRFFRTDCHYCERLKGRVKNARLNGRDIPYGQRRPGRSPEERRRAHRERQKWRLENDPEFAERYRERQRIWAEGKRREKGIPRRDSLIANRFIGSPRQDPQLPIGPFQQWIRERAAYYARKEGTTPQEGTVMGITVLADRCQIGERQLRRFLEGHEIDKNGNRRDLREVALSTVDTCLVNEGNTFLWELYPETDTDYVEDDLLTAA